MQYNERLKEYGIFAINDNMEIEDNIKIQNNKITIKSAQIDKINFQILQEKKIKEIYIFSSEVKYLDVTEETTIDINIYIKFECCNFKHPVIARAYSFNNTITLHQCIFESIVDFSKAVFRSKVDFLDSVFKAEVRFIETKFLANQSDSEIIENNFRETTFEGKVSFSKAIFKGRINFALSNFKGETNFILAQFLAKQSNSEIIENDFKETIFEGNVSFNSVNFKGRVSFALSNFKGKTNFTLAQFLAKQSDSKTIENDFTETIFEGKVNFDGAEFQGRVSFALSNFKGKVRFINTQFLANQSDSEIIENNFIETIFEGNTFFGNVIFQGKVSFALSKFKAEVLFVNIILDNCIFNHIEFNKTKFINIDSKNTKTYTFINSIFKDTLSFENLNISKLEFDNVVFNGIVTFDRTNLGNKPHFTNCTFSNQFNIEHKHIQYSYEEIKEIKDYDSLLNYRDLFRKLKSNRIAHHNLIDASELHTQELYARELELDSKKGKTIKEKIDYWQLWFYRNLCDHHTDLLLNLKWLVIAIGLFALLYFISRSIQDIGILGILNPFGICFSIACAFIMLVLCWFGHIERLDFFASIGAVITLWVIFYKPKLIFGIANLIGDKNYNGFENALITIYTILLALVLFSLQKTARKNSIVPN